MLVWVRDCAVGTQSKAAKEGWKSIWGLERRMRGMVPWCVVCGLRGRRSFERCKDRRWAEGLGPFAGVTRGLRVREEREVCKSFRRDAAVSKFGVCLCLWSSDRVRVHSIIVLVPGKLNMYRSSVAALMRLVFRHQRGFTEEPMCVLGAMRAESRELS